MFLATNKQKPNNTRIKHLMEIYNPKGKREFGINEVVAAFQGVGPEDAQISYKSGDQFITPQRSGSCTWNSLKELVEHEFVMQAIKEANGNTTDEIKDNGKAEYREFKTFVKLATIISYYDLYQKEDDLEKQEAMRNQLILAAKDLLKSTEGNKLNKAHQDIKKLKTIKWTAYDLLKQLTVDHANFEQNSYVVTEEKYEIKEDTDIFYVNHKPDKYKMVEIPNFRGVGKDNIKKFDIEIDKDVAYYCGLQSELLVKMYKKTGAARSISDDLAIIQSATNFLDSLPLANDKYWDENKLLTKDIEKISRGLCYALSVYNQVVHSVIGYQGNNKVQQFYNTAAATYLLLFKLMKNQYPEEYKNYGLDLKMFEELLNNPLNAICDDHVLDKSNKILLAIQEINQDNTNGLLFNFNMNGAEWAEEPDSKFIVSNMGSAILDENLKKYVKSEAVDLVAMSDKQKKAWLFLKAQNQDEIKSFKNEPYTNSPIYNILDPEMSRDKSSFIDRYFELKSCARSLWVLFGSQGKTKSNNDQDCFSMKLDSMQNFSCEGFKMRDYKVELKISKQNKPEQLEQYSKYLKTKKECNVTEDHIAEENEAVGEDVDKPEDSKDCKEFGNQLCQTDLQSLILLLNTKNFSKILNPEVRVKLNASLFKLLQDPQAQGFKSPMMNQVSLSNDMEFCSILNNNIHRIIKKYDMQKQEHLPAVLFLIGISHKIGYLYCNKFNRQEENINYYSSELNSLIKEYEGKDEYSLVAMYSLSQYMSQPYNQLRKSPEKIKNIFKLWVDFQENAHITAVEDIQHMIMINSWINGLCESITKNSDIGQEVFVDICNKIKPTEGQWTCKGLICRASFDGKIATIDFEKGQILINGELISKNINSTDFIKTEDFKLIYGNVASNDIRVTYGAGIMFVKNKKKQETYQFQICSLDKLNPDFSKEMIKINNITGERLTYVHPKELNLPTPVTSDYNIWKKENELVFEPRFAGDPITIESVLQGKQKLCRDGRELCKLQGSKIDITRFLAIEKQDNILLWKEGEDYYLELYSYRSSIPGKPLFFKYDKNNKSWLYGDNPEYKLVVPQKNLAKDKTLFLQNTSDKSKYKIIIPDNSISKSKGALTSVGFSTKVLSGEDIQYSRLESLLCRKATYTVDYKVCSDSIDIVGTSVENLLAGVYFFMLQKNYTKAYACLSKISRNSEILSLESQRLIKQILSLDDQSKSILKF